MKPELSVVIPFEGSTRFAAASFAEALSADPRTQVILAGSSEAGVPPRKNLVVVSDRPSPGDALKTAIEWAEGEVTVLQEPHQAYSLEALPKLVAPIKEGRADVVVGRREQRAAPEALLGRLAAWVSDAPVSDPLSGQRAFRSSVLRDVSLKSSGVEVEPELLVKLAAQLYRFCEVPVAGAPTRPTPVLLRQARKLLQYATTQNDADNAHEGYNTLARMEGGAPNYNAWLGRRFNAHAGQRVLEIGAGIGTITALLAQGREKVVALEVDDFYVKRLKNRFRDQPNVVPYKSDVALADWQRLRAEKFDSIVLSNVLEHIEDDGDAVRRFAQILTPGGKVLILVPALPLLFGSMDEAVGHFRRYTMGSLRKVLEANGFDVQLLEWMNLVGIPGWLVNSRLLRRRAMPPLQLRLYDQVAPLLAAAESKVKLPVGMSLFCVAQVR
ncbi:MAG: methyltransferase domain-containing protein [Archangiaceae bacterium]|nr:methyltransferase domain-containing protein [Archangiaceae bacterium]